MSPAAPVKMNVGLMRFICFCAFLLPTATSLSATDFDGSFELEQRVFFESLDNTNLGHGQTSGRLLLELFHNWNKGNDQIVFEPFFRIDSDDEERSHADIRQLLWSRFGKNYELSAGIGRVFCVSD